MRYLTIALLLLSIRAFGQVNFHGCQPGSNCRYIDPVNGLDTNDGLSESSGHPWKHLPFDANAASVSLAYGVHCTDAFIIKGGTTTGVTAGTITAAPFNINISCPSASGNNYPGLYVGYDPNWNTGTVGSVRVTSSGYNCTALSVTINNAPGDSTGSGATASCTIVSDPIEVNGADQKLVQWCSVTAAGSNYTKNPLVSFAGSTCTTLPTAVANITSPIISGAGATFGNTTSGQLPSLMSLTGQYMVLDGLDIGHYNWYDPYTGSNGIGMVAFGSANQIFQNGFVHDFAKSGAANGNLVNGADDNQTAMLYFQRSAQNATGQLLYNTIGNNYESESHGCFAYPGGVCVQGTIANDVGSAINNVFCCARAFVYTLGSSEDHQVSGNVAWSNMHDANTQHGDSFYFQDGTVAYNNILHDVYSGNASFYVETVGGSAGHTHILFNNVAWLMGSSTPAIGFSSEFGSNSGITSASPGPVLKAFNNSFLAGWDNVAEGENDCINAGQWNVAGHLDPPTQSITSPFYNFTLQNNFCVSDQTTSHWYDSNGSPSPCTNGCGVWNGNTGPNSAGTQAVIDPVNTFLTQANAASQGYGIANAWAPTSNTNVTVTYASGGNSVNLTSLCSTSQNGISLAPLCSDINGNARPTSGGWQAGAYMFGSGPSGGPTIVGPGMKFGGGVSISFDFNNAHTPTLGQ